LLGSPGSGKTSILNSIMEHQSKNGIPCVYQSLDMGDNLLYLRLLQKYTGLPVDLIMENFKSESPDQKILDAYAQILENYSKVHFNFRSAMTVDQMDNDIIRYKQETGLNPKIIAVDYLEKVRSDYTDPTISSGMVASQLSDLAKKHDALVMVLLQPQKSAGDASQELLSMRKVKGASVIEQDLRVILTAWRYGFNPSDPSRDKYMSIGIVKNNLGETAQIDFGWHGLTGQVSELNRDQRKDLMQLRADLAAAKQESMDI
jgi:replicative DNA helicase